MILDRTVQSVGPEQWIRARVHISFTYTHQTLGVSAHGPGTEYVDLVCAVLDPRTGALRG